MKTAFLLLTLGVKVKCSSHAKFLFDSVWLSPIKYLFSSQAAWGLVWWKTPSSCVAPTSRWQKGPGFSLLWPCPAVRGLNKNTQTLAQRGTFPASVSHTATTTERQRQTAGKQGSSCTSGAEGKSSVYSSKEGKNSDKHKVNFAHHSTCSKLFCGLYLVISRQTVSAYNSSHISTYVCEQLLPKYRYTFLLSWQNFDFSTLSSLEGQLLLLCWKKNNLCDFNNILYFCTLWDQNCLLFWKMNIRHKLFIWLCPIVFSPF